ncbi:MAG: V-type ATP synthase subunit I [Bacillota bacterium]
MAVENMKMMNLVAPIEDLHDIAKEIVLLGNVHVVNALHEINESNFTLCVLEENIEELVDMCLIKPYREDVSYKDVAAKIKNMLQFFSIKPNIKEEHLKEHYDFQEDMKIIEKIYGEVYPLYKTIENVQEELKDVEEFDNHFKYLKGLDIDLECLNEFNFFHYKIGILSKENRLKLKKNYENISAVVLHIGSNQVGEVYLIISPKELETETDRILRSLNFYELEIPKEFSGTPQEVNTKIEKRKKGLRTRLERCKEDLQQLKERYGTVVERVHSRLVLEEELSRIKKETACTNSFFYLSGWVPERDMNRIRSRFEQYGHNVLIMFKETTEVYQYMIPPTKLKNNKLLKPFEALVKMYGVPSYNETDPTIFLSITYMLLFGAMFGDIGQGLVLFFIGLFARRKMMDSVFGDILTRLGLSSTIFGFLYGSVFGFEHIIPAVLIRPIENINQMLTGSVVIGIFLLLISFGYSIRNAIKQRNLKEGLFGRNGLAGLLFYLTLLVLVANAALGSEFIPNTICYLLLVIFMALIVVREPLANWILKKPHLYEEDVASYYIESGFDILETLLNMLSSTVSFIRVGAFALNHVGLFIAFETMAEIANNAAGSVLIYIIGNVIVIGLEGLIVFIQGLRLEYYEMFSKYYRGEGVEFRPARIYYE